MLFVFLFLLVPLVSAYNVTVTILHLAWLNERTSSLRECLALPHRDIFERGSMVSMKRPNSVLLRQMNRPGLYICWQLIANLSVLEYTSTDKYQEIAVQKCQASFDIIQKRGLLSIVFPPQTHDRFIVNQTCLICVLITVKKTTTMGSIPSLFLQLCKKDSIMIYWSWTVPLFQYSLD